MEFLLEDILFNSSFKKHYNNIKKLSSKQIKDFLDYKIDDEIVLEISKFIQSNFNQDEMIKFIPIIINASQTDWLNIKETCFSNQYNIDKKTKKQIDEINKTVIESLEKLQTHSNSDDLTKSELSNLLKKLKNIKELGIHKFNFEKLEELKNHLTYFKVMCEKINNNQIELESFSHRYLIKDSDKFSKIMEKIYINDKRKYVMIGNSKGGKNFRDIVIPDVYVESPLSKLKSTRFKFDDIQNIYIFIRKLFFIKILKRNNIPVKNLDLSKFTKDYILYRGSRKLNEQFCIFKMSEVRLTDNEPMHIFYKNNGKLIIAHRFDELKKFLIEDLHLEEIQEDHISLIERLNFLYSFTSILSANTMNSIYSLALLLANENETLGNILSTINYLFYLDKKLFLKDYISIREDGVIFRDNTILQLLALSDDYPLIVNGIKNLTDENEDELIENIVNNVLIDLYINMEKTNILEKLNPTSTELSNILSNNKADYIKNLKDELKKTIKNFHELYQKIGGTNFSVLIYSLLIRCEKRTTNNIFCYDLSNAKNTTGYKRKASYVIQQHNEDGEVENGYFVKHYRYANNSTDNEIKLSTIYPWSFFNRVGSNVYNKRFNFCSGATTFQLLCYLVLDYKNENEKNDLVINKITDPIVKDFFFKTNIKDFYGNANKSFQVIKQLHQIFTSFRNKLIDSLNVIKDQLGDDFLEKSYGISRPILNDPFAQELPGHPLVILILLDNLFGLDVYYKKDTGSLNLRDDLTYQDFYNILYLINTKISISNTKKNDNRLLLPSISNSNRLDFVISQYINFYWHTGHGDTILFKKTYEGKLRFDEFLRRKVLRPIKMDFLKFVLFDIYYLKNLNNFQFRYSWFKQMLGHKANNILFMKNINPTSDQIYEFLFTAKNKDDNDRRVKHILNNVSVNSEIEFPELFTIKFDLNDYNEENIDVDFFYKNEFVYDESKYIIPSILKNTYQEDDGIFNKKMNEMIRENINNLSPEDKLKKIIKNTSESILNCLFLKQIFTNQKDFKTEFIKNITSEMNTLIKKVVKQVAKIHPKVTENDIKFVLKGGMNFYTLYYKFLTFEGNNHPLLKNFFLKKIGEDKRSDYDFTILINPKLSDKVFYYIYHLVNKKVSQKCIYYQKILEKNLHIKFNIDKAAIKIKQEINEIFVKEGIEEKDIVLVELNYYYGKNILKTISTIYTDKTINVPMRSAGRYKKQLINLNSDNLLIKKNLNDLYFFKKYPKKKNFYVTFTMDFPPINGSHIEDNLPLVKNISSDDYSVYYYANESLTFFSNEEELKKGVDGKINSFFLHRIKKNIKVKLEDINENIYFSDIGVELLDIAVPNKTDFYYKGSNLLNYVEQRKYNKSNINIFNVIGLIKDYVKMFFYESEYPWSNIKYVKRLDRFLILITIHNIDNLSEFYTFIEAIESRSLSNIKDKTNKYIIENLTILFERTRDVPDDYSTFESNLLIGFKEIKDKINQDNSNNSIIMKVGIKDKLSKDNLSQKIKNFSFLVRDKRNGQKINLIYNLMSSINQADVRGEWKQKLPAIKLIIDQIKKILSEDPNSFQKFENIDTRFNSLVQTISTTLYEYDEKYLQDYNLVKNKETKNILRIIKSLNRSYKFYNKGLKNKINILIQYIDNPSNILSETSLENLSTLMNIDFNKKQSLDLEYLKKYKFIKTS